jgi:hypothetical protein
MGRPTLRTHYSLSGGSSVRCIHIVFRRVSPTSIQHSGGSHPGESSNEPRPCVASCSVSAARFRLHIRCGCRSSGKVSLVGVAVGLRCLPHLEPSSAKLGAPRGLSAPRDGTGSASAARYAARPIAELNSASSCAWRSFARAHSAIRRRFSSRSRARSWRACRLCSLVAATVGLLCWCVPTRPGEDRREVAVPEV